LFPAAIAGPGGTDAASLGSYVHAFTYSLIACVCADLCKTAATNANKENGQCKDVLWYDVLIGCKQAGVNWQAQCLGGFVVGVAITCAPVSDAGGNYGLRPRTTVVAMLASFLLTMLYSM
jgi:hypothetical protein